MKVTKKPIEATKAFVPFILELRVETPRDLQVLWHRFNMSNNKFTASPNKPYFSPEALRDDASDVIHMDSQKHSNHIWEVLDKEVRAAGLLRGSK